MEIFAKILQGSYAYLLIFQVMVVSLLLLALIWLIIRRTQEVPIIQAAKASADQPAASVVVNGIPEADHNELKSKYELLQEEIIRLKGGGEEAKTLREKVKYLESRLLEYEILQEEIGTLSQLKIENEHLKEELVQAQSTDKKHYAVPAPERGVPESAADTALLAAMQAAPPNPPLSSPPKSAVENVLVTPVLGLIPESGPASPANSEALAKGEDATSGLESLLDQIDKLTSPNPHER